MIQFQVLRMYVQKCWVRTQADDDERGASLVEYALLISLIALVCFAAVGLLGDTTGDLISSAHSGLD